VPLNKTLLPPVGGERKPVMPATYDFESLLHIAELREVPAANYQKIYEMQLKELAGNAYSSIDKSNWSSGYFTLNDKLDLYFGNLIDAFKQFKAKGDPYKLLDKAITNTIGYQDLINNKMTLDKKLSTDEELLLNTALLGGMLKLAKYSDEDLLATINLSELTTKDKRAAVYDAINYDKSFDDPTGIGKFYFKQAEMLKGPLVNNLYGMAALFMTAAAQGKPVNKIEVEDFYDKTNSILKRMWKRVYE
jgi:hypothetical protein